MNELGLILYDLVFSKRIVIRTMGVLVLVLLEGLFLTASEDINSVYQTQSLYAERIAKY
jgi:cell division protein FtsL